jgi:FtsP/CotA-like multicopper oxidase with cupredoxin domain
MARCLNHDRPASAAPADRQRSLTRRRVVAGTLGVAGASALGVGLLQPGGVVAELASVVGAQEPEKLRVPDEEKSEHGLLRAAIVAGNDASRGLTAVAYGSSDEVCDMGEGGDLGFGRLIPGPTLRLVPGDRIKLKLTNCLNEETNLHFHGLHVTPIANSDNVFLHLMQGDSYEFEVNVPPEHPTGLFWYHPHLHGVSSDQVERGLAGAIIIDPNPDEPEAVTQSLLETGARYPGPPDALPRLLVFQRVNDPVFQGQTIVVNGQVQPVVEIRRREEQRWQILNATANHFVNIHVEGHELVRLAVDGNWIPEYRDLPALKVLPLGPAERAEVLITGTADEAIVSPRVLALRRAVPGGVLAPVFDRHLDESPEAFKALIDEAETIATLSLLPDTGATAAPPPAFIPAVACDHPTGETDRIIAFTPDLEVDHKHFSAGRVDQTVALGTVEIWEILNQHRAIRGWHPFHLHVNDFDVLETSDEGLGLRFYQDTIPLPPQEMDAAGNAKDGMVRFCSRFVDFAGRFVYHCHFLIHEDEGMMAAVEVATPVAITAAGFPEIPALVVGPKAAAEVNAGITVIWTNTDEDAEHTVTADEVDVFNGRRIFDSGPLAHGCSFAHTFDSPGTIPYHCANHPEERGVVVVQATQTIDLKAEGGLPTFVPAEIAVALGTEMSWTNRDSSPHTIAVAKRNEVTTDPVVDSPELTTRAEFRQTFGEGSYEYWSTAHPAIKGYFTVAPVRRRSVSLGIFDSGLEQQTIKVPAGSTVTWTNRSATPQTITELLPADSPHDGFDSGPLDADTSCGNGQLINFGQRFSHQFDSSAIYFSKLAMKGEILVSEDAPEGDVAIEIRDGEFAPAQVEVQPNATVTWTNVSSVTHSVTKDNPDKFSVDLTPRQTHEQRFPDADNDPIVYYSTWALRGEIEVVEP